MAPPRSMLSEDDYFRYSAPFRQWLFDSRGLQLGDFKSNEARAIFANDFVAAWNGGKLPAYFYEEGPQLKTRFSTKTVSKPQSQTSEFGFSKEEANRLFSHSLPKPAKAAAPSRPVMLEFDTEEDRIAHQRRVRDTERATDSRFQKRREEDLEEIAPKKEGRAREVEKRRERSAYTRHDKMSNDLVCAEKDIIGGESTSFEATLRRQQERDSMRNAERGKRQAERASDLETKRLRHAEHERKVQDMFKAMLRDRNANTRPIKEKTHESLGPVVEAAEMVALDAMPAERASDTMYFLVATDNHLGFMEKDPVRGNDSFQTFEEILQLARQFEVDALLLGGDLFHENKPSRRCMHTTMELLRHYCLGSRPCALELLSDPSVNFPSRFGTVNYEDPNFNVALPVFSIHGNHDDPTGDGNLSALDILSTAGLINYFGKSREVDDISMMPVLLRKGTTQLALYGLGNVRDERLHRTFLSRKVKMLAPSRTASNEQDWFNLLLFHQNRVAHGPTSVIPDSFLDDSLDLVIRGHEHDNQIEPLYCAQRDFYVSQPGSSVATCLSEGECARPKAVALLEITGKTFKLHSIVLKTVRPFVMSELSLKDAHPPLPSPNDVKAIEKLLCTQIERLIDDGKREWLARQGPSTPAEAEAEVPLPLVRLKVDYSGGFASFNPHRFGHFFVNKVANPKDCLFFYRKRATGRAAIGKTENRIEDEVDRAVASLASAHVSEDRASSASGAPEVRMEDLIHDYLNVQNLDLFPQNEFGDAVRIFVEKDDRDSIEGFVKKALERVCSNLQSRSVRAFDDASLRTEIEREKLQREMEWQRLHPGMGAVPASRPTYAERIEEEEQDVVLAVDDEDLESVTSAPSTTRRRPPSARGGRGAGRGRAPPATGAAASLSSLPMENKPVPATLPASRWPPRR